MTTVQKPFETTSAKKAPEKKQLPPRLAEFRQALEDEIETIEKNGLSSTLLRKGTQVKNDGSSRWYEFTVDYMPVMPADTPCKLIVGKDTYEVTVISTTEHTIIIACSSPLPPSMEQARLENGATVLMERLIKRIEDNAERENLAAARLLDYPDPADKAPFEEIHSIKTDDFILDDHNNDAQTAAVKSALNNNVTYIWGPPGTGKTSVIAQIIHNLYRNERSVLLISHTNTAVDGAIAKVDKEYGECYQETTPYPLLRLGKAFQELPERLSLEAHVEELGKELYARKDEIEKQEQQGRKRLAEIDASFLKKEWLTKTRLTEAGKLLHQMTLLEEDALHAKNRFSEAEQLYQQEVENHPEYKHYQALLLRAESERQRYEVCAEKLRHASETLESLPERLKHAQTELANHEQKEDLQKRNPIHLLNTANFHAWVTGVKQAKGHSRLNFFSAAIDVTLAFSLIENKINECIANLQPATKPAVLIVAPYKPHVKLIEQYIAAQYSDIIKKLDVQARKELGCTDLGLVKVGTIHQFQGSEAEIVIFDLVIDEPHWRANLFMNEPDINAELRKMFNVAVTRAKFKLYIVGNFDYCRKRAKDNALGELLAYLVQKQRLPLLDAKEMFPRLTFAQKKVAIGEVNLGNKVLTCSEAEFSDYFIQDLQLTQQQAIVFSPFMTENRLSQILPVMTDCINRGCKIIVVTKGLADRGKRELEQYKKCEEILRNHGVHVIHKQNMHEKNIFIDHDVVWNGSLNALSFSGTTGEVMQRFCDKDIFEQFEKVLDLEHMIEPCTDRKQQKCPLCGGTMVAAESSDGGFYWTCDQCDYSRNPSQPYPEDGILRCAKCGAPYAFTMKTQPRWTCTVDSKHYQAIRKGDLKLPEMLKLIPKNRYKEVNAYFVEKTGKGVDALVVSEPKPGMARPVLQLTDDQTIIKEYPSLADAVRETGISSKSIRDAAKGVQKHAGGYCWKYADE